MSRFPTKKVKNRRESLKGKKTERRSTAFIFPPGKGKTKKIFRRQGCLSKHKEGDFVLCGEEGRDGTDDSRIPIDMKKGILKSNEGLKRGHAFSCRGNQ